LKKKGVLPCYIIFQNFLLIIAFLDQQAESVALGLRRLHKFHFIKHSFFKLQSGGFRLLALAYFESENILLKHYDSILF